jgi:hypothetical protein
MRGRRSGAFVSSTTAPCSSLPEPRARTRRRCSLRSMPRMQHRSTWSPSNRSTSDSQRRKMRSRCCWKLRTAPTTHSFYSASYVCTASRLRCSSLRFNSVPAAASAALSWGCRHRRGCQVRHGGRTVKHLVLRTQRRDKASNSSGSSPARYRWNMALAAPASPCIARRINRYTCLNAPATDGSSSVASALL